MTTDATDTTAAGHLPYDDHRRCRLRLRSDARAYRPSASLLAFLAGRV